MLAFSVLPLACFVDSAVKARIEGGVFQDFAPSPYHLEHVLAVFLRRMGTVVHLEVTRPGYVPRGAGMIELTVTPAPGTLQSINLTEPGVVREVRGVALASHLTQRRVTDRMAAACQDHLTAAGLSCAIDRVDDTTAKHAGASLAIWAESTTGARLGADRAGAIGRSSEAIGAFVAKTFLQDLRAGATVDRTQRISSCCSRPSRAARPAIWCRARRSIWPPISGSSSSSAHMEPSSAGRLRSKAWDSPAEPRRKE